VYFAYRQSWLGLALMLGATVLVVIAIRRRETLTRREQAALNLALARGVGAEPGARAAAPCRRHAARRQ
jgi:hypothetical protein